MSQETIEVNHSEGLHARPAAEFVKLSNRFKSKITLRLNGRQANGKHCGVCGEMGGDPEATALLLGLGVNELSMSVGALGPVKLEIRRTSLADAQRLASEALTSATAEEVRAAVQAFRSTHARGD
ncbi:MAG: HPr family phosphocarrier protein [Nitrososphaerota archaeon]